MRALWESLDESPRDYLTYYLNQLVQEMNTGQYELIPRRLTTIDNFLHWHLPTEVLTPFMGRLDENNGAAQVLLEIVFLRDSGSEDTSLVSQGNVLEVNHHQGDADAMSVDNSTGSGSQGDASMGVVSAGESNTNVAHTQDVHTPDAEMSDVHTSTTDEVPWTLARRKKYKKSTPADTKP